MNENQQLIGAIIRALPFVVLGMVTAFVLKMFFPLMYQSINGPALIQAVGFLVAFLISWLFIRSSFRQPKGE